MLQAHKSKIAQRRHASLAMNGLKRYIVGNHRRATNVQAFLQFGSNSLNALVNAFERLHMVRGWNSSCTGCNAECIVTRSCAAHQTPILIPR